MPTWFISKGPVLKVDTIRGLVLAALLSASWPTQAQIFSDNEARVEEWQKDVNRRLEDLQMRVERLDNTARGQLDLQNQIQTLRQEIAGLRGSLETQSNEIAQTQRRQRDFASEVETRMKRFEPVAVTIDGTPVKVDVAERRAYEAALAAFRAGDFRTALAGFQQFQGAYPQSPYSPAVQYWIGSCQFALKENRAALTTMQAFVNKHPDHPRAPDAWLLMATAQTDMGDRKGAAETYRAMMLQYPDSPAAATARDRLAALSASPAVAPAPAAPAASTAPASTGSKPATPTKR